MKLLDKNWALLQFVSLVEEIVGIMLILALNNYYIFAE
jgi:hypothetical protein